jgi:protein-glutamine gamma-glutamyltransferase
VNPQRTLGFLLMMLQAVALGYGFRTWGFSAVVMVLAAIGWLSPIRLAQPSTARRWPLVLAILYLAQRTLVPQDWYSAPASFMFPDACLTAQYFLLFQLGQLFVRREADRLPPYLPFLAMLSMIFIADVQLRGSARAVYQVFSLVLIVLSALYFASCRLPGATFVSRFAIRRGIIGGVVLILAGATAWWAASSLYAYSRDIERILILLARSSPSDSAGFSGQGRLTSVAQQKERSGNQVALRVWSEEAPGYLRGRAFDTYGRSTWHPHVDRLRLTPESDQQLPPRLSNQHAVRTFVLSRSDAQSWTPLEIWPNQPFRESIFVPFRLAALQVPFDQVTIDVHGSVETEDLPVGRPYFTWSSIASETAAMLLDGFDRQSSGGGFVQSPFQEQELFQLLTALPADFDPRVQQLADRLAGSYATDGEKIAAVQRYFLQNYQYQVGITIAADADPLTYFLLEQRAAHCEYFATGAAMLLRAVGVPCRYVTGFVAVERNRHGGYWLARNRDAHAWVEAYDRDRGWVLVEATPVAGVPQSQSSGIADQVWDAWRARWQRAVAAIRQGGVQAILGALGRWLQAPWLWVVWLLLATAWMVRRLVHRWTGPAAVATDPQVAQLQRWLHRMDRRWHRAGITRAPNETPHQFADRLVSISAEADHRQAAQWYRHYAAVRYGGQIELRSALETPNVAFREKMPRRFRTP